MSARHFLGNWILLCAFFVAPSWAMADPVKEALEEAQKLIDSLNQNQNAAAAREEQGGAASGEKPVPDPAIPGQTQKPVNNEMKDIQSQTRQPEDGEITPPEQAAYPGVTNKSYVSGGNGKPSVFIYYPAFGSTAIDRIFQDFAEKIGHEFEEDASEPEGEEDAAYMSQIELTGFYTLSKPSPNIISVTFNIYDYMGGAHGQIRIYALNYNLDTGKPVTFADLFANPAKALEILSTLSAQKLRTSMGDDVEEEMLADGVRPVEENFSAIALTPDGINVEFQPYQVGPWAIGAQRVEISLSDLAEAEPDPAVWAALKPAEAKTVSLFKTN